MMVDGSAVVLLNLSEWRTCFRSQFLFFLIRRHLVSVIGMALQMNHIHSLGCLSASSNMKPELHLMVRIDREQNTNADGRDRNHSQF